MFKNKSYIRKVKNLNKRTTTITKTTIKYQKEQTITIHFLYFLVYNYKYTYIAFEASGDFNGSTTT